MLDRNIFFLSVSLVAASAVMLDLDNYAPDFTQWKIKNILENRCISGW